MLCFLGPTFETSETNYQSTLRNIQEERRANCFPN